MDIGYFDCFSGVAGDMWVGALLDLGLDLDALRAAVASLELPGVSLEAEGVHRAGLTGTQFRVTVERPAGQRAPHRHLGDVLRIVDRADLPAPVAERVEATFRRLGEAEAAVHGVPIEQVHFHEVGAEDTIVDVVCACLGVYLLGLRKLYASAVTTGSGTVRCEHGVMPVPAPGALGNLLGIPVRSGGPDGECVTPTGAALLRVLVDEFEPRLAWTPRAVGYGAGSRDDPEHPNLLRLTVGTAAGPAAPSEVWELGCNLDTATGELLAHVVAGALERGALDAFVTAVQMKKARPGHLLTVLVDEARRETVTRFLLEESTSLGVRRRRAEREVLERWRETRDTELGPVTYKVCRLPSGRVVRRPEDDEVMRLVREHGLGRREVEARLAGHES